jgi:hypothetical protein
MIYSEITRRMQTIPRRRSTNCLRASCNSDDMHYDRFMATGKLAEAASAKASATRKATFAVGLGRIAVKIATAPTTKAEIRDNCLFVKETAQQP